MTRIVLGRTWIVLGALTFCGLADLASANGYPTNAGGGGYPSASVHSGGYPSGHSGSYPRASGYPSGYPSASVHSGGYPSGHSGGYPSGSYPRGHSGSYPRASGNPSGYPSASVHSSGYPGASVHSGGYPSANGNPSGYPSANGHSGGYPSGHSGSYPSGHSGGYPGGYPGSSGTRGHYPSYSFDNYRQSAPRSPLTEVDKLFARLADVDAELHILTESMTSAQALLAKGKAFIDSLVTTINEGENIDDRQDEELDILLDALDNLENGLVTGEAILNTADPLNTGNINNLQVEGENLVQAIANHTAQQGDVERLGAQIPFLQTRLATEMQTAYQFLNVDIAEQLGRLRTVQTLITGRQCESGTITLHKDDKRAMAIFQTNFRGCVPQVLYGIAGYQVNLKTMATWHADYQHPHGHGISSNYVYYAEPNAVGLFVSAIPTPDSVLFQATNLGFGDYDLISVKINFQACNIGPDPFDS